MECEGCREWLSEYLDGELREDFAGEIAAHLASCKGCSMEFKELGRLRSALGGLEAVPPPPGFAERVRARVERESRESLLQKIFSPLRWKVPAGALAAAATLFFVVWILQTPKLREPIKTQMPAKKGGALPEEAPRGGAGEESAYREEPASEAGKTFVLREDVVEDRYLAAKPGAERETKALAVRQPLSGKALPSEDAAPPVRIAAPPSAPRPARPMPKAEPRPTPPPGPFLERAYEDRYLSLARKEEASRAGSAEGADGFAAGARTDAEYGFDGSEEDVRVFAFSTRSPERDVRRIGELARALGGRVLRQPPALLGTPLQRAVGRMDVDEARAGPPSPPPVSSDAVQARGWDRGAVGDLEGTGAEDAKAAGEKEELVVGIPFGSQDSFIAELGRKFPGSLTDGDRSSAQAMDADSLGEGRRETRPLRALELRIVPLR